MSANIGKISEIAGIAMRKETIDEVVDRLKKQFRFGQISRYFKGVKKQGYSFFDLLMKLILIRLMDKSINAEQKSRTRSMDDNTLYRIMNKSSVDWRRLLQWFARMFFRIVAKKTIETTSATDERKTPANCFIIDDTMIAKRGKKISGISKVYDHVSHRLLFGFKMMLLTIFDGKSTIAVDFSLHRESRDNNYGLTTEEEAKQHKSKFEPKSAGKQRYDELDKEKCLVAVEMLIRAVKFGFMASYVLIDSWFVNDSMLKSVRAIKQGILHVVGICKMDNRKFTVEGKELNSKAIISIRRKQGKKRHNKAFKSDFIQVTALYKGLPVTLFYIKYRKASTWTLLLTTDTSLSFQRAMELYQIRWSIEVLFKECKQYLQLEKAQHNNFNGQIANAALTLITYNILCLEKRFRAYETIGGLFRDKMQQLLELTLYERIMQMVFHIIIELLETISVDVEQIMKLLLREDKRSKMIKIAVKACRLEFAENSQ